MGLDLLRRGMGIGKALLGGASSWRQVTVDRFCSAALSVWGLALGLVCRNRWLEYVLDTGSCLLVLGQVVPSRSWSSNLGWVISAFE